MPEDRCLIVPHQERILLAVKQYPSQIEYSNKIPHINVLELHCRTQAGSQIDSISTMLIYMLILKGHTWGIIYSSVDLQLC